MARLHQRRFVDCHHLVFWSNGGETKVSNLICLCRYHHRLVHEGRYRLEMDVSGKLRLWKPDGTEIPVIAPGPRVSGPGIAEEQEAAGLLADKDTLVCGYADPFDLHDAMEWLYRANHPRGPGSAGAA